LHGGTPGMTRPAHGRDRWAAGSKGRAITPGLSPIGPSGATRGVH